ncbi:lipid-A-disaccharide synthase [Armatimonas rosea]|uniref:Lipid-A-disaccharide synthase n=1 Tax=Armatimonas rosea TaxID=685828 RepID=A0A7W9STR1_ARMRO|nr:hypothetical protein [Armatimonas rosea]MBB6051868.1 lipid-A-disaccharide synthase [Armatimonas rosea]
MRVAITAAEASGDRVAGQLAHELRRLDPAVELYGSGGKWLREAGAEVIVDASSFGVIGLVAGMKLLPQMLAARRRLLAELKRRPPDVLIPIDAGAFHLGIGPIQGLVPWARKHLPQTKILYYFPPGSWRKTLKYTPLSGLVDAVASPFPWNASELNRLGVRAEFVGHPLLDLVKPTHTLPELAQKYGLDTDKPLVGLLPGSRSQEIDAILPTQLAAALQIAQRLPGVQFMIALAPTVDRTQVEAAIRAATQHHTAPRPAHKPSHETNRRQPVLAEGSVEELARRQKEWIEQAQAHRSESPVIPPFVILEDATYDMLSACDALICKSGTTTLEAAILGKPMVIVYKLSKANTLQIALVRKSLPRFVGMPNLIAGEEICPELLQDAATPEAIATHILDLLLDPDRMARMRRSLQGIRSQLGEPGGAERTARLALDLAQGSAPS